MKTIVVKAAAIKTEPLVEPPDGRLDLVDVFDKASGAPFSAGMCEVYPGNAIDFGYDSDAAVCYMIEGSITLTEDGVGTSFEAGDIVYIPQKEGLVVYWSTESYGKFFYVTYPHWR